MTPSLLILLGVAYVLIAAATYRAALWYWQEFGRWLEEEYPAAGPEPIPAYVYLVCLLCALMPVVGWLTAWSYVLRLRLTGDFGGGVYRSRAH
jgi:hypothetical protein